MSCSTSSSTTTGSISLKFIVVGGGIAGISTACALKMAGHSVVVLEKRDLKSMRTGTGFIRAPPNMTKLLYRWGLGPILNQKGRKCDKIFGVNGNNGEVLGHLPLGEEFLQVLMTDMLLMRHIDLFDALYDLAIREEVEIRQNVNVIHADPRCVSVTLDTGEIISGDIIVAADGYSSSLLSNVTGYRSITSTERTLSMAFTVETYLLKDDEDFVIMLNPENWTMWFADGAYMQTYIGKDGKELIGVLSCNYSGPTNEGDEEWSETRGWESLGLDITAFEPRLQKLLRLSTIAASRMYFKRPLPQDFVNDCSSIVLVGEAAHPIAPFETYQGTALAIEDAVALGSLFSRIQSREQTKQLLTAYDEIRSPRCIRLYQVCQAYNDMTKQPMGPPQEIRDASLRATLVRGQHPLDEGVFLAVWGDQLAIFDYDTDEAVEDWWSQWGFLISEPRDDSQSTGLEVWISTE